HCRLGVQRSGKGAPHLRVDGREHLPRSQDARLRHRRHRLHAQNRRPWRQVRGFECALCRVGACGRTARARRLRHPHRAFAVRLQEPRAASDIVSKAQHCRAEVFLSGFGWVPVDPADVRKVALEEPPGQLALDDPKVAAARKTLFGAWEMNWLAYNFAHDVELPGSTGPKVGFLMYPQAESTASASTRSTRIA